MTYRLLISNNARQETFDAYNWYEDKLQTLGDDFLCELEERYTQLAITPFAYGFLKRSDVIRFTVLDRFPYIVIYMINDNAVTVLSVRHTSRQPYL